MQLTEHLRDDRKSDMKYTTPTSQNNAKLRVHFSATFNAIFNGL